MSIRKAQEFYQSLTSQQKHFVDNKTINTTLSINHWIAFLKKASDFDEYGDKARGTLAVRIGTFGITAFVSVFFAFATEFYYLFIVTAILLIFLFNAIQTRIAFASRDINDYLRVFFMPFLEIIKQKAGEDAKLSASLDFRDPIKSNEPEKFDIKVRGSKRNVRRYEPKMIIAGVTLSDQSYMETVLLDEISSISYTNPRGKSKSKTKTLHRLFIKLTIDKKVYRRKGTPPSYIEFTEDENTIIFKLKHREKEQAYGILNPQIFFKMLGTLYGFIEPIRQQGSHAVVTPEESAGVTQPTTGSGLVEALVWNDLIFDSYDYDSTLNRRDGVLGADDDSRNIFDS